MEQVIIVGGGLAGLSAAHTVLQSGGSVTLLEKSAYCGGNSTKATSGINGSGTCSQRSLGISDSPEEFFNDTVKGGAENPPLAKILTHGSSPACEWLTENFGIDLSLVSRLGGHSQPRTHRGKAKFPGMTITYALLEALEALQAKDPNRCKVLTKCRATRLIKSGKTVIGIEYQKRDGGEGKIFGPVILSTGGYGADFSADSLLARHCPNLLHLPTTNGEFTTGDGIKMTEEIGGGTVDLKWVQVHPTGLVNEESKDAKVKFLAAEALRGVGGILIDSNGNRFCNELGRRDYVTAQMWKNSAPFRLILNGTASQSIEWHCKHYKSRKLMKHYISGELLAKDASIPLHNLKKTFDSYNTIGNKQLKEPNNGPYEAYPSGKSWDPFGKKFFEGGEFNINDELNVSIVTPVIHYCMGGIKVDEKARVLDQDGCVINGLFGAGEVNGGIHGNNRLGGNSLLDCVVYGRVAGSTVSEYLLRINTEAVRNMRCTSGKL